ncbi:hypothetical protein AAG747_07915 [Rapidithrix thailandica]|uniref:Uncharacterized protein n=1 Tax=Rapidithrix thailandica TaxID=413964 RepID=A0AAW9S5X7_9BACT
MKNTLKTVGTQRLLLDTTVKKLTLPQTAVEALLVLEAEGTAKAARWWTDGSEPTTSEGMLLGDTSVLELTHRQDLERFQITGIDPGKTSVLTITYYGF